MCGIVGVYSFRANKKIGPDTVSKMCEYINHRGPDDRGIYLSPDQRLILGHRRLSIIDLSSKGHQPMCNRDGRVWISFNGQIYNYRQLRDELKAKNYEFSSNSDTEVIIHGYQEWGIDRLLERLRGMFAFAIYDLRFESPKLILARDRFGIKPLYYYQDNEQVVFSSEVGAIVKSGCVPIEKNREIQILFLIFGNIPAPLTTIKNILSFPAASYLSIEDSKRKLVKYYNLMVSFTKPKLMDSKKIYQELLSILSETIDIHLISDAPVGIFLSGGIDSSVLVTLATQNRALTTLSVVFDEEDYSEVTYQRIIADKYKTGHHEIKITQDDFYAQIDNIFRAMDQPTIDGINTYFISKAAKEVGLKTVLSGTGGDEVFCGYASFRSIGILRAIQRMGKILKFPLYLAGNLNDRWSKLNYLQCSDPLALYLAIRGLFAPKDAAGILAISEKEVSEAIAKIGPVFSLSTLNPLDWLSYTEINFYLKNQLLKDTDTMSMYHSVETRVPYLDHILVEYVASVSPTLKVNHRIPKPLLVKSLKGILPDEIIFRKKQGFTFPFDLWLKKKARPLFEEAVGQGDIDKQYAKYLWQKFELHNLHWSRVWGLIILGLSGKQ